MREKSISLKAAAAIIVFILRRKGRPVTGRKVAFEMHHLLSVVEVLVVINIIIIFFSFFIGFLT